MSIILSIMDEFYEQCMLRSIIGIKNFQHNKPGADHCKACQLLNQVRRPAAGTPGFFFHPRVYTRACVCVCVCVCVCQNGSPVIAKED